MAAYADSSGRTLKEYPRPSVAVDTAVLTVAPGAPLSLIVVRAGASASAGASATAVTGAGGIGQQLSTSGHQEPHPDREQQWRLPGTFLHEGERLADAVLRSLRTKAGITGLAPRQLEVFDDPARDDRGWVLSVAHVDAVPSHRLQLDDSLARLVPVTEIPALPYGHGAIVARAVESLRERYRTLPDPAGFVAEPFTLRQLQEVHEAVAGESLMRDTFRRGMRSHVDETGELSSGSVGKPARLYRRLR